MSVVNAPPVLRVASAVILLATVLVVDSPAQLVMSNLGAISAIVENFDTLGSSTTLPLHWRVAKGSSSPTWSSAATQVDFAANSGEPQTNGTYNWGDSGFTNRALGMLIRSTARSDNFMLQIKTSTYSPSLGSLSVAYSIKQFYGGAGGYIDLYYSTNGSSWNLVSSTLISYNTFPTSIGYFFEQPNTLFVPFKEFAVPNVPPNSDIYLRWQCQFSGDRGGYGIDDIWITSFQSAVEPSDFTYQSVSGGIAITGYTGTGTAFAIPSYINGQRVSGVADSAFAGKASIKVVALPNTVTSIDNGAFNNCTNLWGISIPASVTNIGSDAFSHTALTSVDLGSGVRRIGDFAFFRSQVSAITIPSSVTNIGVAAFAQTPLTTVNLGSGVTSIGDYAFDQTQLNSITTPSSVTNIGTAAFAFTPMKTATIARGKIGPRAFQDCSQLTNINLGSGVTGIGSYAFRGTQITNISIPASVISIGTDPFVYCGGLTAIAVAPDNLYYSSLDGVLFNKSQTELVAFPSGKAGAYSVPSTVTHIGDGAFRSSSLSSILFRGDAPLYLGSAPLFAGQNVFYLPGRSGWGDAFAGQLVQEFHPVAGHAYMTKERFLSFSWTDTGAIPMSVQRSTSLSGPWTVVSSNNAAGTYTDPSPPAGQAFYRAVLP